jgi:hypothetical protein
MKPTPGYPLPTRREKWESLSTEYDSWSQWHALGHLAYKMHERLTLHHLKEEKHSYKRLLISLAGKQDFKSGNSQIINLYLETHTKKKKVEISAQLQIFPKVSCPPLTGGIPTTKHRGCLLRLMWFPDAFPSYLTIQRNSDLKWGVWNEALYNGQYPRQSEFNLC